MKIERSVYLGIPAAALAGLILFTYFSYRDEIGAAEARVSSASEVVESRCGRIEYAVIGKGAPVLVVHGAGGGFDQGLESPRYELERIATPALVISIENDLFGTYQSSRSAAERIPGARFVSFPAGGHLWAGRQEEVLAEMTKFLGDRNNSRADHAYPRPSTRGGA